MIKSKDSIFNCLSSVVCITRQREYQLHRENKYLKIEYLLKSQARIRVWLFFYFYDTFFRCGFNLFVDILHGNKIYILSAFRLVILLQCRKANKKNGGNPKMKKVVYSIKKVRNPDEKLSGFGFINDEGTLLCKCVSKTGKRYTRAFDEVEQHCHPIIGKEKEFKGYVTIYYNDVPLYNKEHDNYDVRDIEVEYSIWYKIVEEN